MSQCIVHRVVRFVAHVGLTKCGIHSNNVTAIDKQVTCRKCRPKKEQK